MKFVWSSWMTLIDLPLLIDGRVLQYDAVAGIWTGGIGGSVGLSSETQTLDNVLALGSVSSRSMSVSVLTITTSFSGDGSGLTGLSSFSGDYNDLGSPTSPTIPTNVTINSRMVLVLSLVSPHSLVNTLTSSQCSN